MASVGKGLAAAAVAVAGTPVGTTSGRERVMLRVRVRLGHRVVVAAVVAGTRTEGIAEVDRTEAGRSLLVEAEVEIEVAAETDIGCLCQTTGYHDMSLGRAALHHDHGHLLDHDQTPFHGLYCPGKQTPWMMAHHPQLGLPGEPSFHGDS